MAELSSRQRLLRLFSGRDIDRIPIWLLAPWHPLKYYADIYHTDSYREVCAAIDQYCDTFDRRRPELGIAYNVHKDIIITEIHTSTRQGTHIHCGSSTLESYVEKSGHRTRRKFLVDDPQQLIDILSWPYEPPRPSLDIFRQEMAELGDRGLYMLDLGDPLEPLYHLCDPADFSMWTLTDLDILMEFIDITYERAISVYKYFLDNNIGDVFFIVGAEFAGPPLVSPSLFNQLSEKYVKGIADLIRSYGKYSIVHFHGQILKLLNGFKSVGANGLHTIEAPPIGDCTLTQARAVLGKETVLIGNIQYDDLARLKEEEIDKLVYDAIEQGKSGRFILSPTAGPYEKEVSPKMVSNYLAFIRAGIEYGRLDK